MMEGMETRTWKHFVGGQWVGSRKTRDVVYPWDASKVGTVALAGPESVERAIAAAVHVADELARTPAWRRAAWLEGIVDGIRARRDELVDLIVHEGGKPRRFAEGEVARAIQTFTLGVEAARSLGGEVMPVDAVQSGEGRIGITRRFPKGPVAAITPFNFPLTWWPTRWRRPSPPGAPWSSSPPTRRRCRAWCSPRSPRRRGSRPGPSTWCPARSRTPRRSPRTGA